MIRTFEQIKERILEFNYEEGNLYCEVFFEGFILEISQDYLEHLSEEDVNKEILAEVIYDNYLDQLKELENN